jgi:hypothetical protein
MMRKSRQKLLRRGGTSGNFPTPPIPVVGQQISVLERMWFREACE